MSKLIDKQALAERIVVIQRHFKMNSRQFAIEIGMDPSQMNKIEKGQLGISTAYATTINERFGVSMNWLLTGKGDKGMWKYVPHELGKRNRNMDGVDFDHSLPEALKELMKDNRQTKATVNILKITVAQLMANSSGETIEKALVRLDRTIDEEADRLYEIDKKKYG